MMRWVVVASVIALLALPMQGFVVSKNENGQERHWDLVNVPGFVHENVVNRQTKAVRYFLAEDAFSETNTAAELNAVRSAFAQWEAVPGSHLKFEDAGLIGPLTDINSQDNTNTIFWLKESTSLMVDGQLDNISGTLGVTYTSFFSDNILAEADLVLNGVQFDWYTDFRNTNYPGRFVEGTVLHEIGHFIGLDHSPVGGATMVVRGSEGVDTQVSLSADEFAAARAIYPQSDLAGEQAAIQGQITLDGTNVLGAAVVLEDADGNMISGTVSREDGSYELKALPAGDYRIRVVPLDPAGLGNSLIKGRDISFEFNSAQTRFQPTENRSISLGAGQVHTEDFALTGGSPAFRMQRIHKPNTQIAVNNAVTVWPGQSDVLVGVYSAEFPAEEVTLSISGEGVLIEETSIRTNAVFDLDFLSTKIDIAADAVPGLRSFKVQAGDHFAYANGYLEILPPTPDYNFDGLDDRFQREYFEPFVVPEAAPDQDPDGDGFNNREEYIAGSVPVDAGSVLEVDKVILTEEGATVSWDSAPGRKYQVFARDRVTDSEWEPVGDPVTATGTITQVLDVDVKAFRFYRVQALP